MATCPQTNNTTIIETSVVSYDSTPLPCTDVKVCDDLNTILTKFDNVICSAIDSVNILIEEVTNITEDLMLITEDVETINNQIFICCPICEFTGTADELPECDFIGSATQLPTPSTTTTTSSSSTSTSTTTSSSTSTTTSTTTIAPTTTTTTSVICKNYKMTALNSTPVRFNYTPCGFPATSIILSNGNITVCCSSIPTTTDVENSTITDEGNC